MEEPGHEALYSLASFETSPPWQEAFNLELPHSGFSSVDESLLLSVNPYLGMRNNTLFYIDPDGRNPAAVGAAVALEIARKVLLDLLKNRGKKMAKCAAIHQAYDAAKKAADAKPCGSCQTCPEYLSHLAFRAAEIIGRRQYLSQKCDYVLVGSIFSAGGSKAKEKTHHDQLRDKIVAFGRCGAKAVKAGCANIPTI